MSRRPSTASDTWARVPSTGFKPNQLLHSIIFLILNEARQGKEGFLEAGKRVNLMVSEQYRAVRITIDLRRRAPGRISIGPEFIEARVVTGSVYGANLLAGRFLTEVDTAKITVIHILAGKGLVDFDVNWIDRTEGETGSDFIRAAG